jgi:hypothetical protein
MTFEISSLADLDIAAAADGSVGPRTGRTHETTERYALWKFLREAIPAGGIFELPASIRHGDPNGGEPDFIMTRRGSADVIALIEVTISGPAQADRPVWFPLECGQHSSQNAEIYPPCLLHRTSDRLHGRIVGKNRSRACDDTPLT